METEIKDGESAGGAGKGGEITGGGGDVVATTVAVEFDVTFPSVYSGTGFGGKFITVALSETSDPEDDGTAGCADFFREFFGGKGNDGSVGFGVSDGNSPSVELASTG